MKKSAFFVILLSLACQLEKAPTLSFDEHIAKAQQLIQEKAWRKALRHTKNALKLSQEEAIQKAYQDQQLSPERIHRIMTWQKAEALPYHAWALYQLGKKKLAFTLFQEAYELSFKNLLGITGTALRHYWAKALMQEKQWEKAKEVILPDALFLEDPSAVEDLKEIYQNLNVDLAWEAYLRKLKGQYAVKAPDFHLLDYQGKDYALSELTKDHVTALVFWFPT